MLDLLHTPNAADLCRPGARHGCRRLLAGRVVVDPSPGPYLASAPRRHKAEGRSNTTGIKFVSERNIAGTKCRRYSVRNYYLKFKDSTMKIGVVFPQTEFGNDPQAIRDYAQAVEAMGYTHVIAYDHVLGANPDRPGGWRGAYT